MHKNSRQDPAKNFLKLKKKELKLLNTMEALQKKSYFSFYFKFYKLNILIF